MYFETHKISNQWVLKFLNFFWICYLAEFHSKWNKIYLSSSAEIHFHALTTEIDGNWWKYLSDMTKNKSSQIFHSILDHPIRSIVLRSQGKQVKAFGMNQNAIVIQWKLKLNWIVENNQIPFNWLIDDFKCFSLYLQMIRSENNWHGNYNWSDICSVEEWWIELQISSNTGIMCSVCFMATWITIIN